MVIGIFGESCTGKSTLASRLKAICNATVYSGKDYLRLSKQEDEAKALFRQLLTSAVTQGCVIYVISEPEQLSLLPGEALRILVTADLETIQERFAQRMHGKLPPPVAAMLERKHGCFDHEAHDIHVVSGVTDLQEVCKQVQRLL